MSPIQRPNSPSGPDRERCDELDDASDQDDPAPGVEVADDEFLVLDEEVGVVDGGDAPDAGEHCRDEDHDASEEEPAAAPH
jgi:hypothetical protein